MAAKKPLVLDSNADFQQIQTGDFLDITNGGTGAVTASGALTALGAYPASNPSSYITSAGAPVQSVAGHVGAVVLNQADIGGLTTSSSPTFSAVTATTFTGALAGNASTATNVAASGLTGTALASNVVSSSLTSVGTLTALTVSSTINGSITGNAATVTTNANLTGDVTSVGNATSIANATVTGKLLTGYVSSAGTVAATDSILVAIEKLNGNTVALAAAVTGANVYQGVWNATTNVPALASGVGTKGYYYKVSVAGSTSVDGNNQWNIGDMIIFDGTTWDKLDGISSEVTTVAGRVGAVVLAQADITGLTTSSSPTFAAVTATTFTGALAGNATTATTLATGNTINGINFTGASPITVTAAASTLTGTSLASNVVSSSLTSVGTISTGTWNGTLGAVSGAALTNLTAANLTGTIPSTVLGNSTHYIGTTAIALNRASGAMALTGITSIDGNAATATNVAASGITGATLASNVVASSLTSVGTITTGTWSGLFGAVSGANLTNLTAANINGTLTIAQGGTGATTATAAATALGLGTNNTPVFAGVNAPLIETVTNDTGSTANICSIVYLDATGGFQLAEGNTNATSHPYGFTIANIASAAAGAVATDGGFTATVAQWNAVTGGTTGLTPGATYFLSTTTAGQITSTVPTTGYLVKVGQAVNTTTMNIQIGTRVQL